MRFGRIAPHRPAPELSRTSSIRRLSRASLKWIWSPGWSVASHSADTGNQASAPAGIPPGVPLGASQIRAGFTTRPRRSRLGCHTITCGPGSTGPVLSLGPARSIRMRQGSVSSRRARSRCPTILAQISGGFCGQLQRPPGQVMQNVEHGIECAHHVRLAPAERGETEHGKLLLQQPDIVMSEREIVQEIVGTFAPRRMHARKQLGEIGLELDQRSTNFSELGDQNFERIGLGVIRVQCLKRIIRTD